MVTERTGSNRDIYVNLAIVIKVDEDVASCGGSIEDLAIARSRCGRCKVRILASKVEARKIQLIRIAGSRTSNVSREIKDRVLVSRYAIAKAICSNKTEYV